MHTQHECENIDYYFAKGLGTGLAAEIDIFLMYMARVSLEITVRTYKRARRFSTRLRGMGKNSYQSLEIFSNHPRHHSGPNSIVCANNDI